jgi:hypothetical protein
MKLRKDSPDSPWLRHRHFGPEESGHHLAPAIEPLARLIGAGGIASDIDGGDAINLLDFQRGYASIISSRGFNFTSLRWKCAGHAR